MKNLTLSNPWVLDIVNLFKKQSGLSDFSIDKLLGLYQKLGYDKIQYNGIKRWGLDSSTDSSDIKYDDIDEGMEMFMRKYTANGTKWIVVKVTHKHNGIIFFETLGEKKNKKFYIDTGANDYEWIENKSRYTLPKQTFYPIEVIVPDCVDISSWNAPRQMVVTKVKNSMNNANL